MREENVYYPPAIRALGLPSSRVEVAYEETDPNQGSPTKALPSSNSPSKEVGQTEIADKEKDISKGVVPYAIEPLIAPKDSSKGKETSQSLEIVLATLPFLPWKTLRAKVQPPQLLKLPSPLRPQEKTTLH